MDKAYEIAFMTRSPDKRKSRPAARRSNVEDFLRDVAQVRPASAAQGRKGRLVFALDATMSRQPTWDRACRIQGDMFLETAAIGGLTVQLVYFRGYRDCRASAWTDTPERLAELMTGVACRGGMTQIGRVLKHIRKQAKGPDGVDAAVYIGDACEEAADPLCHLAGELGMLGVPLFLFHEGGDPVAGAAFKEMARLSGGAYAPFDSASPGQLRDLLRAVAAYAAGGRAALEDHAGGSDVGQRLLLQMRGPAA